MLHLRTYLVNLSKSNISHVITDKKVALSRKLSCISWKQNQQISTSQPKIITIPNTSTHTTAPNGCPNVSVNCSILLKRFMSYDSKNETHKKIHELITNSKKNVFVFMKGEPKEPLCRYSGVVVQVLDAYGVDFDSANVLENENIRKEIKNYSDWPTIPQVYVNGTFVGGCDILLQMHESGELKSLFKIDGKDTTKPPSG